ncbi:MAG: nucleotidyltransferase domain-containing protein [bacterium]|nr:nucleotidyltransferase domain-containing protein [bacterium]
MRLSKKQINAIKDSVYELDLNAGIYLYGSRVDNTKAGGDIDLLIISNQLSELKDKSKIRWKIYEKLGEQKIDILLSPKKIVNNFIKTVLEKAEKL